MYCSFRFGCAFKYAIFQKVRHQEANPEKFESYPQSAKYRILFRYLRKIYNKIIGPKGSEKSYGNMINLAAAKKTVQTGCTFPSHPYKEPLWTAIITRTKARWTTLIIYWKKLESYMFKKLFLLLVTGHILGDFYTQTKQTSEKKDRNWGWVSIHGAPVLLLSAVLLSFKYTKKTAPIPGAVFPP